MGCTSNKAADATDPGEGRMVPVVAAKPAGEQAMAKAKADDSVVAKAAVEASGGKEPETIEEAAEVAEAVEDLLLRMVTDVADHKSTAE